MLIHRMITIFEDSGSSVLELSPGLNILQASDETGRKGWRSFLLAMLYGTEAPEGMVSGRLDCESEGQDLTLLRATRQGGARLGEFRAITGDGRLAAELTGENCGKALLGTDCTSYTSHGVIEAAEPDSALAEGIASIGPSLAEGTEFRKAIEEEAAFLQSGRTGLLPTLEAELQETTALLATRETLASRLESQRPQKDVLAEQALTLEKELASLERWEAHQQAKAYRLAEEEAAAAEEKASSYRRRLDEEGVPETGTVSRLRGAIVNLNTTRKNSAQTRSQRDKAAEALLEAETRLNENPFVDMTKEEALAKPLHLRPKPRFPGWGVPVILAIGLILGLGTFFLRKSVSLSIGCGSVAAGVTALAQMVSTRRKLALWEEQAEKKRAMRETDLAEWERLLKAAEAARAENTAKSAAWETLQSTIVATEQGILREVRRFAPGTTDIPSADAALRAAAVLRKELADADAAAREARIRCSLLPVPEYIPEGPVPQVFRTREDIQKELDQTRTAQASLQSELDRLTGRLQSIGDPEALRSRTETLADQISAMGKAYGMLSEALTALERGKTEEQFQALTRRTAEIFAGLLSGTSAPVQSDEEDAEETEPQSPSNAASQLYLASRLAACQMSLPERAPLLLDDVLAGLDGESCQAALRWLQGAARERQILLFTTGSREGEYFRGDETVNVQQLVFGSQA